MQTACAHDKLGVCLVHHMYSMAKRALVTSLFVWRATCGRWLPERALVTSLLMWCMSSMPRLFNRTSAYDKYACNKEDTLHIINFYSRKTCTFTHVPTRVCKV